MLAVNSAFRKLKNLYAQIVPVSWARFRITLICSINDGSASNFLECCEDLWVLPLPLAERIADRDKLPKKGADSKW